MSTGACIKVDWLGFRAKADLSTIADALSRLFTGSGVRITPSRPTAGKCGFATGRVLMLNSSAIGRLDYGGDTQQGWCWCNLTGQGCSLVEDWTAVAAVQSLPQAAIKRLDVALTTLNGEVTHETVVRAHAARRFHSRGRPPEMRIHEGCGPGGGRTCYIGRRSDSNKFFRGYEKGLIAPARGKLPSPQASSAWQVYRCEVEFKAYSRPIAWAALLDCERMLAGAYPFLGDVLHGLASEAALQLHR